MKKSQDLSTKDPDGFIHMFMQDKPDLAKDIIEEDNRYYILPEEVKKTKENISRSVFSAGAFMGEKKKGRFYPSLLFIEKLAKISDKKVFLGKKAEWLFLCGRDVFIRSIEKKNTSTGYVFIQNLKDENLGIGRFREKVLENMIDRGDYLRREK